MADYDFTYTGAEIQAILDTGKKLKDSGYIFLGVATPSTNPGTPTQKVYYEAKQAGTYTNFGGVVLPDGISLLIWNGSWTSETVMCGDGGVFDISVYKSTGGTLATFADLAAALNGGNNIPVGVRKGGMSVKFVQSSDNKYVQFRYMGTSTAAADFTNTANWQGVDANPTPGSKSLVESGGTAKVESKIVSPIVTDSFQEVEFTDGKYISFLAPTTLVDDEDWRCAVVDVTQKDYVQISGIGELPQVLYMFLNASNVVLKRSQGAETKVGEVMIVPNTAVKLIINDKKSGLNSYVGIRNKITFTKGNITTAELNSIYDSGTYKYENGGIVIVTKYSNTSIRQVRISPNSNATTGMEIDWRTYDGTIWGNWTTYKANTESYLNNRLLLGRFSIGTQLNSKLETGIWQGDGCIVVVRRRDASSVVQWRIYNLQGDATGKPHIEYRSTADNGTTWGDWIDWTNGFITTTNAKDAGIPMKIDNCVEITNPQLYPVNNVKYHAANEADIWIDSKSGFMYAVYPENDTSYYETKGRVGMSVFSMATPWNVEHYEVFKTGDTGLVGTPGVAYLCPIESNGKLRIFIQTHNSNGILQYKDFDLVNKTFGNIQKVQYNGSDLTASVINNLIVADGGESQDTPFVRPETLYNNTTAKDGYTYQMFSIVEGSNQTKAILRSNDGFASVEYVSYFPYPLRYDGIMDYYNGVFYFLYRKASSSGLLEGDGVYLTTTEDFETYTTPVQVSTMDMRPDIFVRDNYVYLVVGDKRNQGQGFYRTNCHVLKGTGATAEGYTKIVNVTDDRGMVNPRARLFGDDIHILVSDSPIRLDKENGYYAPIDSSPRYQGKECECYLRVRMT